MPEANGVLLIKAPAHLLQQFDPDSEKINRKLLLQLFDVASVKDSVKGSVLDGTQRKKRFAHEGIELDGEFVQISPFGDEWLHPLQALVKFGAGIEIYGSIHHEYGYSEYYALNDKGERFFETINYEGGFDKSQVKQTVLNWLACAPTAVQEKFPDVFASEYLLEEGDTVELAAEAEYTWTPVKDSDFVTDTDAGLRLGGDLLHPKHYQREHLIKAKALGAGLLRVFEDGSPPKSELHYVITSIELNVEQKTRMAIDMLDVFDIELNQVCRGYSEMSRGTALYLAAKAGLADVVKKLVDMGADPQWGKDWCPLNIARAELKLQIRLKRKPEDVDMSTRNEGVREDYEKIVAYLESLHGV